MSENIVEQYLERCKPIHKGGRRMHISTDEVSKLFEALIHELYVNEDGTLHSSFYGSVRKYTTYTEEAEEACLALMQHAYNMGKMEAEKEIAAEYDRGYNDGFDAGYAECVHQRM